MYAALKEKAAMTGSDSLRFYDRSSLPSCGTSGRQDNCFRLCQPLRFSAGNDGWHEKGNPVNN